MKRLFFIFCIITLNLPAHLLRQAGLKLETSNCFAQKGKYGATLEDSIQCVQNLSLYIEFFKQKNYQDAIAPWRWLIANCPKSSKKMYINGVKLMKYVIKNEKDAIRREKHIDTLMMVYDQRIKSWKEEGKVLGKKGADMYKYRKNKPDEAFETLERSVKLQGDKSEAGALVAYFQASVAMLKREKIEKENVIEMFGKVSEIIDHNLSAITNEKKKGYYLTAKENIEKLFEPIASCEDLIKMYGARFKDNAENVLWLTKATQMLDKKNCTDDPLFIELAETLHNLEPSAISAYNIGKMLIGKGQYSKASTLLRQAVELEEDNNKKANYYLTLAGLYSRNLKQYSQGRSFAQKAIAARPGWGKPYIMIGDMYSSTAKECGENDTFKKNAVYWAAVDKYRKAKYVDNSITEDANKKIATYSKYFPKKNDAFFYNYTEGESYTVNCWINETTTVRVQ